MNPINTDVSSRNTPVVTRTSPESHSSSRISSSLNISLLGNGQMPATASPRNVDHGAVQRLEQKVAAQDARKCVRPSSPRDCSVLPAPRPAFSQQDVVFDARNPLDCLGAYGGGQTTVNITNLILAKPAGAKDVGTPATPESVLLYAAGTGVLPSLSASRFPLDTGRPGFWQLHSTALPLRYGSAVIQKLADLPQAVGPARLDAQATVLLNESLAPRLSSRTFDMITFALPPAGTDTALVHEVTLHQVVCALQGAAHREVDFFILSLPVESLHRQTGDGNAAVEIPHLQAVAKAVVAALKLRSQLNVVIPADGSRLTALIKQYASGASIGISH